MFHRLLLISLTLLGFAYLTFSSVIELSINNVDKIARQICDKPDDWVGEIKSVANMAQVIEHFIKLPASSPLHTCRERYMNSLLDLKRVLDARDDGACGERHVNAFEEFNRKYLSTTEKDAKIQKKTSLSAPFVLKVFFSNYVFKVSVACKKAFLDQYKAGGLQFVDISGESMQELGKLDHFVQEFNDNFAVKVKKIPFTEFYLPWKMIDNLHVPKKERGFLGGIIGDCSPNQTEEECVRLSIRVRDARPMQSFQHLCRTNLRPIYSKQILPIIRMVSLGIYEDSEPLVAELETDENLRRLFSLTQACETAIPVQVFQRPDLRSDKVIVLSKKDANELRVAGNSPSVEIKEFPFKLVSTGELVNPSLDNLNEIDTLSDAWRYFIIVKAGRLDQEKVVGKLVERVAKRIRNHMRNRLIHLFEFTKSNSHGPGTEVEMPTSEAVTGKKESFKVLKAIGKFFLVFVLSIVVCSFIALYIGVLISLFALG